MIACDVKQTKRKKKFQLRLSVCIISIDDAVFLNQKYPRGQKLMQSAKNIISVNSINECLMNKIFQ